ncbi:hypothetical protein D7Y15_43990, partial [Corallococcus sp. AB030]
MRRTSPSTSLSTGSGEDLRWKTLSSRFYRWQEAGIWARVLRQLQAEAHEDEHLDWTLHFLDASV